jgi:isopenicillin-N N-acyltransferase-like protein
MGEILLGGRRTGRARKWLKTLLVAAPVLAVAMLIATVSFHRATTYPVPTGSLSGTLAADGARLGFEGSSLERVGKLWVLRLAGAPWKLGLARGRLLGGVATRASSALDATIVGEREPEGTLARQAARARLRWALRLLADGLPRARREELGGLAAGLARVDAASAPSYQVLVRRQAALDLGAAPGSGLPVGGVVSGFAFATVGGTGLGDLMVGRAFALPGAADAGEPTVTFARPDGALAYAAVGWADQIGVVTGVNAEGIAVLLDPAVAEDVRATAARPPLALVARDVLERAHTLDEAIAVVKDATPLGAGSFLLVDGKARTYAVVERTPGKVAVRRGKKDEKVPAPMIIGDSLVATELVKDAENERLKRVVGRAAREARLAAIVGRSSTGANGAAAELAGVLSVLRDRRLDVDRELPPGHPGAIDDLAAQHVVIIDATSMMLWVGEGPGAAGAFRAFDLRTELRDEAPRPLAPDEALVPADRNLDAASAERALEARAQVTHARMLLREGGADARRRAAEAAERALALAPALPGAWRIAARVARDSGDAGKARVLYRAYLERTPADPSGEEEARGFVGGP